MSLDTHGDYGQRTVMSDRPIDCWLSFLPSWLDEIHSEADDIEYNLTHNEHPLRAKFRDLIRKEPLLFRVWYHPKGPKTPLVFDSALGFGTKEALIKSKEPNLLQRIIVSNSGLTFPPKPPNAFARGFVEEILDEKNPRGKPFHFVAARLDAKVTNASRKSTDLDIRVLDYAYSERSWDDLHEHTCRHWLNASLVRERLEIATESDDGENDDFNLLDFNLEWTQVLCPFGISVDDQSSLLSAYNEIKGDSGGSSFSFISEYCYRGMNNIESDDRSELLVHELPMAASNSEKYTMFYDFEEEFGSAEDLFVSRLESEIQSSKSIKTSVCYGAFAMMTNDLLWTYFNRDRKRLRLCKNCGAQLLTSHARRQHCSMEENPECYRNYEKIRKQSYRKRQSNS